MIHALTISVIANVAKYVFEIDPELIHGYNAIIMNTLLVILIIFISQFTYIHIENRYREIIKKIVSKS